MSPSPVLLSRAPVFRYRGIFGTDGIRALAGQEPLTPESVRRIGRAAGQILARKSRGGSRKILIGKDTRGSCSWIEEALAEGFGQSGCEVHAAGVIPTSAVAAILQKRSFLGGAVISASHNPAEFNGIKFFAASGRKLSDGWEREIESQLERGFRRRPHEAGRAGTNGSRSPLLLPYPEGERLYTDFLKSALPAPADLRGLNWVLDCAHGAAGRIAPAFFAALGARVSVIHNRPDGRNINAASGALHPEALQREVLARGADGGCAFDGDADRVQFVDEKGRLLDGDILLWIAARHMKSTGVLAKNTVVTTVMANLGFFKLMEELEIRVLRTPVGDRAVSHALEKSGACLGGEQSGHIIFRKFLPTGDGLLTALMILAILRQTEEKLSYFKERFPKYPQLLLNLKVKEKIPLAGLPSLQKRIRELQKGLDGNGRILVRYSGTEPLLRIMVEGSSPEAIRRIAGDLHAAAARVLDVLEG